MLRRTLDQRIRIEVDVRRAARRCLADPGQLESALLNIAINARDAMPDGGTLRFRAEPLRTRPPDDAGDSTTRARGAERFVAIADLATPAAACRRRSGSAPSSPSSRPRRPAAAPASA